jgi:predicted RND superfamily exporter protein
MIKKTAVFILNHPKLIIFMSIVLTIILASGIRNIRIEEDITEMIPKDLPSRQILNELEENFGGSDVILVTIANEQQTIFNSQTLGKIKSLSESIEALPGIIRITSLTTAKLIEGKEWGLEITPFMEEVPQNQNDIDLLKQDIFKDSTYIGKIVSADGKYASIIAVVQEDADAFQLYKEMKTLKSKIEGPERIYLTGLPVITTIVSNSIRADIKRLIPFVMLVVLIILYLSFRTVSGMLLPLVSVLMSVTSMVGLMGHLHKNFMVINNVMPAILIAVGSAYGIHVIAKYYEELGHSGNKKKALAATIKRVSKPVIMAGLTTMAGFISLLTAPLPALVEFGAFLAFGVLMSLLFSLTVIPSFLMLLSVPKRMTQAGKQNPLDNVLGKLGSMVFRYRLQVIAVFILMVIVFAFGIFKVNMEMNPITFFPEESELRQADRVINQHLSGSINMNLLFTGDIESPEILQQMDQTQQFLEHFPEVGSTISLATFVKKINRILHNDDPTYEVIPESKEAVAQAMLLYSMSGSPTDFEQFVDNSYENGQIIALLKNISTQKIAYITKETERFFQEKFSGGVPIKKTGFSVFLKDLAGLVITSQVMSIIISIILVFLIAWITYRSFRIGILATIPLLGAVIINFGLMGLFGIDLSIPTAVISSIIIGVGIDYSFHFISRYKFELGQNNIKNPICRCIQTVGKPILYNAVSVAFGFLVLMISGFLPVRFIGFLVALAMFVCAIGALTLLAAAISFIKMTKGEN